MLGKTMRAVVYYTFGEPSRVLEMHAETPTPTPPKPGEMNIKVVATSINPVDWKRIHGVLGIMGKNLPFVPCFDVAGTVVEVSDKSLSFKVGDHVVGVTNYMKGGALAEYATVKCSQVIKKPDTLSFEDAAGMPIAGITSLEGLLDKANLKKDDKVLIVGASGGTGTFAVQIAKAIGATVIATSSPGKRELVQRLGADRVIDHTTEDWAQVLEGQQLDVVFDCYGGGWHKAHKVLKNHGSHYVTTVGDDPSAKLTIPTIAETGVKTLFRKAKSFLGGPSYTIFAADVRGYNLQRLVDLVQDGKVHTQIEKVYPMNEFRDAFEHAEKGHPAGKVIIKVD